MSLLFPSSSPPAPDRRLPEDKRQVPVIGWRSWKLRWARDGVLLESVFGLPLVSMLGLCVLPIEFGEALMAG